MSNKNITMMVSFLLIIAGISLTAVIPEQMFLHVPFQLMIIAVILLSVHMNAKDIIILLFISSAVVWGMFYFDIIKNTQPLILETAVLFASGFILGIYETNFKDEKHKLNVVWNYKKKETEVLRAEIQALTAENHRITENIKDLKKYFAQ
jgi:hypothetical protein